MVDIIIPDLKNYDRRKKYNFEINHYFNSNKINWKSEMMGTNSALDFYLNPKTQTINQLINRIKLHSSDEFKQFLFISANPKILETEIPKLLKEISYEFKEDNIDSKFIGYRKFVKDFPELIIELNSLEKIITLN